MELQDLLNKLTEPEKLVEAVKKVKEGVNTATYRNQYDPAKHDVVTNRVKRPDKTVKTDQGDKIVFVSRLPAPFQKQIVSRAAAFLCGNPVEIIAQTKENTVEDQLMQVLRKTWDDNKLDYESKKLAKLMMSETEVAELWYTEDATEGYWADTPNDKPAVTKRLRMRILAASTGDTLYPVFNSFGDMVAFGRGYETKDETGKKIEHLDLYTDQKTYLATKEGNAWVIKDEVNPYKKIPVVYYSQEAPEWADVQSLIDRLEVLISNHADTNDYYGSPMVLVHGKVKGFSTKGEQGKVLELDQGADAEYLTWDQSPESVKMEYNNLRSLIMDMTDTPDISFDKVAGLGSYSGIALKMIFLSAHMKAADKEETFGKGIQRRLNFLKAALCVINVTLEKAKTLVIKPRFKFYLPRNDQEEIATLVDAVSGTKPIMSQKTAIALNSLVEDKQAEEKQIKAEQEEAASSAAALNNQFNEPTT